MIVFLVYIAFFISRVHPVHSIFKNLSILKNPSQIFTNLFFTAYLDFYFRPETYVVRGAAEQQFDVTFFEHPAACGLIPISEFADRHFERYCLHFSCGKRHAAEGLEFLERILDFGVEMSAYSKSAYESPCPNANITGFCLVSNQR